MATPHESRALIPGRCAPARTLKIRSLRPHTISVCLGLAMAVLTGQSMSQPAPQSSSSQEQRRAEARDRVQREQQ